jgi:hypothetical protein
MNNSSSPDSRPLPIISDEDSKPSRFVQWGRWLEDRWGQALTVLGGVILAGYELTEAKSFLEWFFFILGSMIFLIGSIVIFRQAPSITKQMDKINSLRRRLRMAEEAYAQLTERAQLANRQVIDPKLQKLAEKLGFGDTDRISVYKDAGGLFSMLGRFSVNPRYNLQGRRSYPDSEGCIGDAYLNGFAFDDNVPDPDESMGAYCDHMLKRWRIDGKVCTNLRMKPRNIAASALYGSSSRRRIGVIVFESTQINKFTRPIIKEVLNAPETKEIEELAGQLEIVKTSIQTALEEEL